MKEKIRNILCSLPVLLVLPYLMVIIVNGAEQALTVHTFDPEEWIACMLEGQIPAGYEMEAVKAQAVVTRTNFYDEMYEGSSLRDIVIKRREYGMSAGKFPELFFRKKEECYEEAVHETENMVLTWNEELKLIPYHQISSGSTRDGQEAFHSQEYSYLKSVDSSEDKKAEEYLSSFYIPASQMPKVLEIRERDSKGYVSWMMADGKPVEGEAFRTGLGLASADFKVQKIGSRYRFLCKGKGHGLGYSQYGGNCLAKAGYGWEHILQTYFPEMEIKNIVQIPKAGV